MKDNDIFDIIGKDRVCYFLVSSYNEPNILIPCKGIVQDYKVKNSEVSYKVKITKFYESSEFLKNYFYGMLFYTDFNQSTKFKLGLADTKGETDLKTVLEQKGIIILINSFMLFDSLEEMNFIFDKLNLYFISKSIFELREHVSRASYNGVLKMSKKIFDDKFSKEFSTEFDNGLSITDFINSIKTSKPFQVLEQSKKASKK